MTGEFKSLGVVPTADGVAVAVASDHATRIEFCLFDEQDRELRRVPLDQTRSLFHAHIADVPVGARYGLRAHGPWAPSKGLLFNPAKLLIDPYAVELDRAPRYHETQRCDRPDGSRDPRDSAPFVPKALVCAPPKALLAPPLHSDAATVLYELHVRGFTMRHPEIPPELRGTFAALAHPAAIAHLQRIGVTTIELMPAMAAVEERHLAALGMINYWGYNPVAFAPDPRLAPGGWAEIRATTNALRAAGIETVLDVVWNHTGEGDLEGPTLSLRGLDHPSYFRLHEDGTPYNDTGCGNTLAMDHPAMLRLAMDGLRAWALWGGVQGFRFDLAVTLARRATGFDPRAPFLQAIAQDPVLNQLKLIAEPWDIGPGGWQTGNFPAPFAEWNDRFRDQVRRFWRGDAGLLGDLATRLAGSADLFRARAASDSVNFITAHDGFTLADLVSYQHKHNEANGEQNRDGTDDNNSWNNGLEGATSDPAILAARKRDQAALLATLLLARGTPMLSQGAELGTTQQGNNNAYAQDNELTWLDWAAADQDLLALTAQLTQFRAAHPWAWQGGALNGEGTLYPDVVWHQAAWDDPKANLLLMLRNQQNGPNRIALVFHRGPSPVDLSLPPPRPGHAWGIALCSAGEPALQPESLHCPPRAVVALQEIKSPRRDQTAGDTLLAQVAAAAGIGADWWELNGTHHLVPPETQRTLLAGMGFPSATRGDAETWLTQLTTPRLPVAWAARQNRPSRLPIPLPHGADPAPMVLSVTDEQGTTTHLPIAPDNGTLEPARWLIDLPPLPIGRYRLEHQGAFCALTMAPERCHQPLTQGVVGLTAQLYSLRRRGDQGIGDFTTLLEAARFAARHGAALLGINPLHALFPADRDRASPYHPSDRRFIDPISIDLTAPDPGLASEAARRLLAEHAAAIAALSATPNVDHRAIWAIKDQVLRAADRNSPEFQAFKTAASPALRDFALFSAISAVHPGSWATWPPSLRDRAPAALRAFAKVHAAEIDYHLYLQFLAESGLARAADNGLPLGLLRDLAVGAAGDGAECWANPDLYVQSASIGAPPDPLAPQGQVWALPPPNPHALRTTAFAPFIELVQANMRHAGALRIDHVLGFKRLFWVPGGASAADGAYVTAPMENLFAELALESARHRCMVIGEDMGTVPTGLREAMADHAILRNRMLLLDYEHGSFPPAASYPVLCSTSVASHDLPTLRGWVQGADIAEREQLGLFNPATAAHERTERAAMVTALAQIAGDGSAAAIHLHVARTASLIATAQIEDLAGETTAVNLPGTDRERPNWRRKITPKIDEIDASVLEAMVSVRNVPQ